jgi:hypothetical protein
MNVEMSCGGCGGYFSISSESENEDSLWLLTNRFTNAHTACGFVQPAFSDVEAGQKMKPRIIKQRKPEQDK